MRSSSRRTVAALFGTVVAGLSAVPAAAQPTTPSLSGENLTGPTVQRSAHCNADGTGYVTFSTSGTAAGPYTGTFSESGVLAVTKSTGRYYEHFAAGFRINSVTPSANIRGGKAEIPPETLSPSPGKTCQSYNQAGSGYTTAGHTTPDLYQAIVEREGQTFEDNGTTEVTVPIGPCTACAPFHETFSSSKGLTLTPRSEGDRD
jgi:hypothetical protein